MANLVVEVGIRLESIASSRSVLEPGAQTQVPPTYPYPTRFLCFRSFQAKIGVCANGRCRRMTGNSLMEVSIKLLADTLAQAAAATRGLSRRSCAICGVTMRAWRRPDPIYVVGCD
jgi:hypothetical protein